MVKHNACHGSGMTIEYREGRGNAAAIRALVASRRRKRGASRTHPRQWRRSLGAERRRSVSRAVMARCRNAGLRLGRWAKRLSQGNRLGRWCVRGVSDLLRWGLTTRGPGLGIITIVPPLYHSWIGRPLGVVLLWLTEHLLVAAVSIHFAARQTGRAVTTARVLNLLFRDRIIHRSSPATEAYIVALWRSPLLERIARELPEPDPRASYIVNVAAGFAHLQRLCPEVADRFFARAIEILPNSYLDYRGRGRAALLMGDVKAAEAYFGQSAAIAPCTVMGHQNYAGRYDIARYRPTLWEQARPGPLMVYDNLMQLAEDQFLLGRQPVSMRLYQRALDQQKQLSNDRELPTQLRRLVADVAPHLDVSARLRLLSYEWVTQFGHIGLLDCQLKMTRLGLLPPATYVLLAPPQKVANQAFLKLWEPHVAVVRDAALVDELFPYQREIGDNFIALPGRDGVAEPWTRRAARAQIGWAEQGREPIISLSDEIRDLGRERLARLGVPEGAWYVGLHVREGGFHGDAAGTGGEHRNSRIEDYLPAIAAVTARGGWVVRLGDPSMSPLQPAAQVIDYAHCAEKSAEMDLFLLATSRFVIGTTSGLTTAALAFDTPMLLVNCISNDWQMWSARTRFILKRMRRRRDAHLLSLGEVYREPIQGSLINVSLVDRMGYEVLANTADEIHQAVTYQLDLMDRSAGVEDENEVMVAYRAAIEHEPYLFGAALPVPGFLKAHPDLLGWKSGVRSRNAA